MHLSLVDEGAVKGFEINICLEALLHKTFIVSVNFNSCLQTP